MGFELIVVKRHLNLFEPSRGAGLGSALPVLAAPTFNLMGGTRLFCALCVIGML